MVVDLEDLLHGKTHDKLHDIADGFPDSIANLPLEQFSNLINAMLLAYIVRNDLNSQEVMHTIFGPYLEAMEICDAIFAEDFDEDHITS